MTFNCHMMLNIDGFEKIPLPSVHLLLSFVIYRDAYLDTNPKIAIWFSEPIPTPTHNINLVRLGKWRQFNRISVFFNIPT